MSKALVAADEIRAFAAKFKAIVSLADYLEEVGKLEQVEKEARAGAEKAKADETKARDSFGQVKAQLDAEVSKIKEVEQRAADLIAGANAEASAIVAEAKKAAGDTVAKAKATAEGYTKQVDAANQELRKAQESIAAANKELQAIEAKIADAKATVAKMMGL